MLPGLVFQRVVLDLPGLSWPERALLAKIQSGAGGQSNKQLAEFLFLSEKSVERLIHRLRAKGLVLSTIEHNARNLRFLAPDGPSPARGDATGTPAPVRVEQTAEPESMDEIWAVIEGRQSHPRRQ